MEHLYETRRAVEAVALHYSEVACQVDCLTWPGPEHLWYDGHQTFGCIDIHGQFWRAASREWEWVLLNALRLGLGKGARGHNEA